MAATEKVKGEMSEKEKVRNEVEQVGGIRNVSLQ